MQLFRILNLDPCGHEFTGLYLFIECMHYEEVMKN